MTRNPMVTRDTTSATEALQLMVQKHFRHLVRLQDLIVPEGYTKTFGTLARV
jgi:hypothetical protein